MKLLLSYLVFAALVALAVWTFFEPSGLDARVGGRPTLRDRVVDVRP